MLVLPFVSLLLAAPDVAAPAHLACTFPDGRVFDVTADEGNGMITTVYRPTGSMLRKPALFTATEVKWIDRTGSVTWTLSRTNLSIVTDLGPSHPELRSEGVCVIETVPSRAF